jgi:hypothetical protein
MGRKIQLLALVAALATGMGEAQAGSITVDFDNLPGGGTLTSGTNLTNQYSSVGVTFSALENGSAVDNVVTSQWAQPGNGNYLTNSSVGTLGNQHDLLRMTFSTPVSDLSWLTGSLGSQAIVFLAYDSSGTILETVNNASVFGLTSFASSNIARVDALQPTDSWVWGLDNLSYTPNTSSIVPEPSTYAALCGLGLVGLGIYRRRSKRS